MGISDGTDADPKHGQGRVDLRKYVSARVSGNIWTEKRDTVLYERRSVSCFMDRGVCYIAMFCGWTTGGNFVLDGKEKLFCDR